MEAIKLGQKVKSVAILRTQVAEGVQGRAVILDPEVRVKQIAYDANVKRRVEVDQDACIKYHLSPRISYFLLIGRLNTDMKGNIVPNDSSFVVEYLDLADSVYTEFVDQLDEMGGKCKTILLQKKTRYPNDKYGYVKPTPSNKGNLPKELIEKIREFRKNRQLVESCWGMIDLATSITVSEYEKLLANEDNDQQEENSHVRSISSQAYKQRALPKEPESDSLDTGDEFGGPEPQEAEAEEIKDEEPQDPNQSPDDFGKEFEGADDFGDFG